MGINMDAKAFEELDEKALGEVLCLAARRLLFLRQNVPDTGFWFNILIRTKQWITSDIELNEEEKNILKKDLGQKTKVIIEYRKRIGGQLGICSMVVNKWIEENRAK